MYFGVFNFIVDFKKGLVWKLKRLKKSYQIFKVFRTEKEIQKVQMRFCEKVLNLFLRLFEKFEKGTNPERNRSSNEISTHRNTRKEKRVEKKNSNWYSIRDLKSTVRSNIPTDHDVFVWSRFLDLPHSLSRNSPSFSSKNRCTFAFLTNESFVFEKRILPFVFELTCFLEWFLVCLSLVFFLSFSSFSYFCLKEKKWFRVSGAWNITLISWSVYLVRWDK